MSVSTISDEALLTETLEQVTGSLGALIDRELRAELTSHERATERPVGEKCIHISFKLHVEHAGRTGYGSVLVPLPDALALASYLLMMPDPVVKEMRGTEDLDREMKDALLELANIVGGAVGAAYRAVGIENGTVRSAGCQGVRADVRPAFPYDEGDPLIVGRAETTLHEFPKFTLIVVLPRFD